MNCTLLFELDSGLGILCSRTLGTLFELLIGACFVGMTLNATSVFPGHGFVGG